MEQADERPIKPMNPDLQKWFNGETRDDDFDWDDEFVQGNTEEARALSSPPPPGEGSRTK